MKAEPWPGLPARLRDPLLEGARGAIPAPVAVMRLCAGAESQAEVDDLTSTVSQWIESGAAPPTLAAGARSILALLRDNPQAWSITKSVLAHAEHDRPTTSPDEDLAHWAGVFDRAAQVSPEASVALYSLADPAVLRAATEEVVARLREWGLLAHRPAILDLGCGIGRFEEALAAEARLVVGVDISRELLRQARTRCARLPNAYVLQTSGRDLACFADASFDLVLAADVFPYLARCAGDLLERHVSELGRVLRTGGDALLLNLSYGEPERHLDRLARSAAAAGLALGRAGTREFRLWDGLTYHLKKLT